MASLAEETTPLVVADHPTYDAAANSVAGIEKNILFHGVTYTVKVSEGFCKKISKIILDDASGIMSPGLNAIMGPTGSGKTSLLDILAGRKNKKGLQGTVLVNGEPQPRNFKCMSGYVVQDDVVMGTLSVKENLYFSAALRLPTSMAWKEKKQRVKKIIDELGLNSCTDTKVGNEFIRGVSGGERKRTNIGMELIIEPEVLFLDEPTTGLDAFTAVATVQLLKQLTDNGGRIIIMSIHQPRYAIYKLFDTLTLLSKGHMVYHGLSTNSLSYFSTLGFNCEEHDNPADFLLDVVNLCEKDRTTNISDLTAIEDGSSKTRWVNLGEKYLQSNERKDTVSKCDRIVTNGQSLPSKAKYSNGIFSGTTYTTNALWQLLIVLIRSVVNLVRNPMTSVLQYIIVVIFGAVVGAVYWQVDTGQNGYQNRVGAIFFLIMNQIFGNLSAIDLFVKQKALFIHENVSGYYRVSTYFIAKVAVDLFCTRFFPLCFLTVIVYFMLGFQMEVEKFFIFFLTLFLTAISASSVVFWVSAGIKVGGIGNLLVALCFVFQMALLVNEVNGLQFNTTQNNMSVVIDGKDLLESQGFSVDWLWYDQIGLAGLCLLFLTLGYITLRLIKKEK